MYDPKLDRRPSWRTRTSNSTDRVELVFGVVLAAFIAGAVPLWCALNFVESSSRIPGGIGRGNFMARDWG